MVLDTTSRVSDETEKDEDEVEAAEPAPADEAAHPPAPPKALRSELIRHARWLLPVIWLAGVVGAGLVSGVEFAFLVLAAGVLVLVITLLWTSVQSLTGSSSLAFEEALGMGAPSKVEEQKRALLRALKDLEYERGVGKISPEDYAELSTKYREEAKRLIQSLDETLAPAREQVERDLQKRLSQEGLAEESPQAAEAKS